MMPGRLAAWGVRTVLGLLCLYGLASVPGFVSRWGGSAGGIALFLVWASIAYAGVRVLRNTPGIVVWSSLALAIVALRAAAAMLAIERVSSGDPHSYLVLAGTVIAGHGLSIYEVNFGSTWYALYPPLYPLLLAGWGAVAGLSIWSVLVFGTLVDAVAAGLIVRLGTRLGSATSGRCAAWLYLVWPSVVFSAPLAQKAGLCAILILGLALGWLDSGRSASHRALAIGLPAGLLALTQPGEAPLAALFALVMAGAVPLRSILLTGARGGLIAMLVMLPWWVRNWLVLHAFVPLTSAGGASLWIGNNPEATGNWMPFPDRLRGLPEITYGKRAGAIAVEWIRSDPMGFVRLTLTKFVRACGIGIFAVTRAEAMAPPLATGIAALLWPVSHGAHVAMLGAAAVKAGFRRLPMPLLVLIAACGLQLMLFGVWFEFGERHREFVTPFLLLLLCWTVEKRSSRP